MKRTDQKLSPLLVGALWLGLSAALPANADYPASVLAQNPVGYWPFDETTASPALNTATNATALGAAGTGYFIRSLDGIDASKGEPGIVGNSVRFYNDGNVVGYSGSKIDVPYTAALNPNPPFTVEFWAKANNLGADSFSPLANLNSYFTGANRSGWIFYANGPGGGTWQFRVGGENSYTASPKSANGTAVAGVWYHVVGVFDGATASLYLNGALAASANASGSAPFKANEWVGVRIGSTALAGNDSVTTWNHPYGNRQFDGWVDEVAIYGRALTADQIAAHHDAASTNNAGYHNQILADNPIGYWGLDEPAYSYPSPGAYPQAANLGSVGAAGNGTNNYGVLAGQPGVPYTGFPANNESVLFSGGNGNFAVGELTNVPPALDIQGQITLSAWIKPTQRDWYRNILEHGNWATAAATFLRIGTGDGSVNTGFYEVGQSDGVNADVKAYFPIPDGDIGNWVHLVGTFDGANWNLYRNGQLVAQQADTVGAVSVADLNWSIGADSAPNPGAGLNFGGWIDEPAIFNTALSDSIIQSLYYSANVPPVITRAPQAPASQVYEGSSLVLSVWAEGNPTLKYQWTKDGSALPGQTSTNLSLTGVTVVSSGAYAVVVTNDYGSVTRSVALTVQASKPIFTSQPGSVTRWAGQPFAFSVAAIGTQPISYQWSLGEVPIPSATLTTYSNIASASVAGNYTATLTNPLGTTNSAVATLTVLPVPAGYAGTILGDSPIAYYRLDETNGSTIAHDYAGGNDGRYHSVTLDQAGYSVVDSDKAAAFAGSGSYVGDISGTAVNFQGSTTPAFSVEAWVYGSSDQQEGATILAKGTGTTGGSANEQFALDVSSGAFRFFVRNPAGTIFEANAATGPDGSWHHLVGVYDGPGGQLALYVDGELAGSTGAPATGVHASSFAVSIGSKRSGVAPDYDLTFDGIIDEVAIYGTALNLEQVRAHYGAAYGSSLAPFIAVQPTSATNYPGLPVTLRVGAAGSMPLSYQWRKDGVVIPGATGSSLILPGLAFSDAGTYTVTISNANGATNSTGVIITVPAPPSTPPAIPGLVLHLPFDNNLTDATGRGNNGTAVGRPTFVTDGPLGGGLHYSTDDSGTNYVTLGVRPDLSFGSNVSFSVSFWIRLPENYQGGDLPFFTDTVNSTFGKGFVFAPSYGFFGTAASGTTDGAWEFSVFDGSSAGTAGHGPVGSINDGAWHHLVYVMDRRAGNVTYLDGVVSPFTREGTTSTVLSAAGDINTGAAATIGQDPLGQYGEKGSADIDDLGVWRRALTPLEAASIYVAAARNKLSYVGGPTTLTLTIETTTNKLVKLSWTAGTLQSADTVQGPYADVTGAGSPYTVSPSESAQRFYRLKP